MAAPTTPPPSTKQEWQSSPREVEALGREAVTLVACGLRHTACIVAEGQEGGDVHCWGAGGDGQVASDDLVGSVFV